MKEEHFDEFEKRTIRELIPLLKELKTQIGDEYRASDDYDDNTPAMSITIGTNEELSHWSYQTGDNSFTGGCYGDPYWGVATLTRDSNPSDVAKELLSSLSDVIEFD